MARAANTVDDGIFIDIQIAAGGNIAGKKMSLPMLISPLATILAEMIAFLSISTFPVTLISSINPLLLMLTSFPTSRLPLLVSVTLLVRTTVSLLPRLIPVLQLYSGALPLQLENAPVPKSAGRL